MTESGGTIEGRKREGGRREAAIIDAAVSIFNERGYTDTSVDAIASAVGILKGSLYYYIDSKEDLLFRIATEVHDAVEEILNEAARRTDLSALDRLAFYVAKQVEYNAHNLTRIAVYHHEHRRLGPERLAQIEKRRDVHVEFLRALLIEARSNGEIDPDVDLRAASAAVFATIIWIYTWYRPGRVSSEALERFCVDFVLHGLSVVDGHAPDGRSPARI